MAEKLKRLEYVENAQKSVIRFLDEFPIIIMETHNVEYFRDNNAEFREEVDVMRHNHQPVSIDKLLEVIKDMTTAYSTSLTSLSETPVVPDLEKEGVFLMTDEVPYAEVTHIAAVIKRLFLGSMKLSHTPEDVLNYVAETMVVNVKDSAPTLKLDRIMPIKKSHEVERMSRFVHKLASLFTERILLNEENKELTQLPNQNSNGTPPHALSDFSLKYLVDIGSGKAYLNTYLSMMYDYNVLGLDSNIINTQGSVDRAVRIQKLWPSLVRRAEERLETGSNEKRGKRWKRRENRMDNKKNSGDKSTSQMTSVNALKKMRNVTMKVDEKLDLPKLLNEEFSSQIIHNFGIVGLHACGDLTTHSIKLFLKNPDAKFLCVVPCCYHLLSEASHFDQKKGDWLDKTFPLSDAPSKFCFEQSSLGPVARMFSSYSIHRAVNTDEEDEDDEPSSIKTQLEKLRVTNQVPSDSESKSDEPTKPKKFPFPDALIYRALFDDYIFEKFGSEAAKNLKLGRSKKKFTSFSDYVHRSLKTPQYRQFGITSQELEAVYRIHEHKIESFKKTLLFKVMIAPVIEEYVLLDSLAFLLKQAEVKDAFIVELFDPKISPRCHAIVAIKN